MVTLDGFMVIQVDKIDPARVPYGTDHVSAGEIGRVIKSKQSKTARFIRGEGYSNGCLSFGNQNDNDINISFSKFIDYKWDTGYFGQWIRLEDTACRLRNTDSGEAEKLFNINLERLEKTRAAIQGISSHID